MPATLVQQSLNMIRWCDESGPFWNAFQGKFGLGEPERIRLQLLDSGSLHAAPQVKEKFGNAPCFGLAGYRDGGKSRDMVVISQCSEPPLDTGGRSKVFSKNRIGGLPYKHPNRFPKSVDSHREGGPRCGAGVVNPRQEEASATGNEEGGKLKPRDPRSALFCVT